MGYLQLFFSLKEIITVRSWGGTILYFRLQKIKLFIFPTSEQNRALMILAEIGARFWDIYYKIPIKFDVREICPI